MSWGQRYLTLRRSIAAFVLLGLIACAMSGCVPAYGYSDYPQYGYAPYSYGWGNVWGYNPGFVVNHPWEEHHGFGHHTQFYNGGGFGHGGGFHGGGGGGFHGGGGGGHGGGGGAHGGGHR